MLRSRRNDLQKVVGERLRVDYDERTIGKRLKQIGFSHISACPQYPAQDVRVIENFPAALNAHLVHVPRRNPSNSDSRTWPALVHKSGLVRQSAKRGTRPRQPAGQRLRERLFVWGQFARHGAAARRSPCPSPTATRFAYIHAMQAHLDEIPKTVARNRLVDQPTNITSIAVREWAHIGQA